MTRLLVPAVKFFLTESSDFPQIMTGENHQVIYDRLVVLNFHISSVEEGFLFKENLFIDRFEAATIAKFENLIPAGFTGPLTSEDLKE